MKKLLLTSIAALFLATGTVHADPLPDIYLGRWCYHNGGYGMVKTEKEWEACLGGDGYMEIKRYGLARHEEDCKFISVKYTGEKTPASTKPTKEDWIPVVRITARCVGEDATAWKSRITFKYVKGGGMLALFLATEAAHAVEIPKQYRGEWCSTQWETIYKRCPSGEVIIDRTSWSVEDETCTYSAIRKSKYGGHRLFGICRRADPGPKDQDKRTEERWWLGSNNMRLQIIEKHEGK
jgi:hypothetical protein